MCDGICSACGDAGAILSYRWAVDTHIAASGAKIVAVDQVVRDARMVRLRFCLFVKNRGGFQLLGVFLVIEVDCAVERECIKDRRSESSG